MSTFRKKPVEVEARQYTSENWVDIAEWCREGGVRIGMTDTGKASIPTLEGTMYASPGDWIIRGVQGEFYPCKPDIFEQTYEPALADQGKPQIVADIWSSIHAHAYQDDGEWRIDPEDGERLLRSILGDLEREPQISEDMVERGALALAKWEGAEWDAEVWDGQVPREAYRQGAQRCLEAALGGEA